MDANNDEGRSRRPEARERTCADCAYFKYANVDRAYCRMHSIAVRRGFGPCEKFRLREGL